MVESLKSLQISIFDIISYVLPGFVLIFFLSIIFTTDGTYLIEENALIVLIASYILGNFIHSVPSLPEKLLWKFYHKYKEKNKEGHGVKDPQKLVGKIAKFVRYKLLDNEIKGNLSIMANNQINNIVNKRKRQLNDIDLYKLKETFFISTPTVAGYYEYLNYQKVFSSSMSKNFLILALLFIFKSIFGDLALNLVNGKIVDFPYISIVLVVCSTFASIIFFKRYLFFKKYRNSIMNSSIILNM